MKTIKGAAGSKLNLLKWLALPTLMMVAFLNIEIGGGSTPGSETRKSPIGPDIGGNSAPRGYVMTTGEIGGGQETRKSAIEPNFVYPVVSFITSDTEIGGQGSVPPRAKPIGGSQVPPRGLVSTTEIGGTQTAPVHIGGGQTSPRYLTNATEIGGPGNQYVPRDKPFGDIGGNQSPPRTIAENEPIGGIGGQERRNIKPYSPLAVAAIAEIGGNGSPLPPRDKPVDIGGQTVPRGFACHINEFPPIGGAQTSPRQIAGDIGGTQTCPRCYKIGGNGNPGSAADRKIFGPGVVIGA